MAGKTEKNAHLWERHPEDWYTEERFATAELFKRETFPGGVWDPACGRGHILAEAIAAGYEATGSDIADRARVVDAPFVLGDFMSFPFPLGESVVFNPPYLDGAGIEAFVRQAMRFRSVRKIAAFVPSKFLWGADRARGFHTDRPASRIYFITPRPSAPPGPVWEHAPEEVGGGSEDFAWCVWEYDEDNLCWPQGGFHDTAAYWIVGPDRRRRKAAA